MRGTRAVQDPAVPDKWVMVLQTIARDKTPTRRNPRVPWPLKTPFSRRKKKRLRRPIRRGTAFFGHGFTKRKKRPAKPPKTGPVPTAATIFEGVNSVLCWANNVIIFLEQWRVPRATPSELLISGYASHRRNIDRSFISRTVYFFIRAGESHQISKITLLRAEEVLEMYCKYWWAKRTTLWWFLKRYSWVFDSQQCSLVFLVDDTKNTQRFLGSSRILVSHPETNYFSSSVSSEWKRLCTFRQYLRQTIARPPITIDNLPSRSPARCPPVVQGWEKGRSHLADVT